MTEQRPITYKSLGFTLGLGGIGGGVAASGTAASSFLETLLASVPSAKALLPTLVHQLSKAKTARIWAWRSTQRGLASAVALQPAVAATQAAQSNSAVTLKQQLEEPELQEQPGKLEPKQEPTPAVPAAEVIDLLSDSDGELEAAVAVGPSKLTATPMKIVGVAGDVKPVLAEFIPLPKTAPGKVAAAAGGIKAAAPGSADALAEEEDIRKLGQRPYWMSYVSSIDSPLLRLHQELVELCELVQPTPEEAAARRDAVAAVTEVVQSIWPNAKCEIFGSYATGLYVPTSDIDLVILDSGCTNIQSGLKALASSLAKRQVGQSLQVIGKARVPIVKFDTVNYGNLAFDVSFDVANGPQAAVLVTEMTAAWPMMRPLILCLKLFLQQRELNEVYTGGIGSYALITLVAAFLQLHASRRPKGPAAAGESVGGKRGRDGGGRQQPQPAQPLYGTIGDAAKGSLGGGVEPGLGTLLVDFFRFYGRVVNMPEVGISCAGGGQFFRKMDKDATNVPYGFSGWLNKERNYLLSVEDPKDPGNDVCRNSFNIMRVKTAFEYAYQMLTAPSRRDESLLARILRLGPILASRPRPRVQHLRELGYYATPPERDELRRDRRQRLEEKQQQRGQDEQLGGGDREKPAPHDAPSRQAEARAATSPGAKAGGAGNAGADAGTFRRQEAWAGGGAGRGRG